MKVVTDYLEQTADYSILATEIPYTSRKDNHKTKETASLFEHLKKEINYIEQHFYQKLFYPVTVTAIGMTRYNLMIIVLKSKWLVVGPLP